MEPQKALYYFFTDAGVLPKTCKHTLMYTICGITLELLTSDMLNDKSLSFLIL